MIMKINYQDGYFMNSSGYPIYFKDYRTPKAKGQVVIANGLHYELPNFNEIVQELLKNGYNVLTYAHRAQHESLEAAKEKGLRFKGLTTEDLAQDLLELLAHRKINKKINLVGLSFGSSVAAVFADQHPERVNTLTFWAPLVQLATVYTMMRDLQEAFSIFNPFGFGVKKYDEPTEAMVDSTKNFDLNKFEFQVPTSLVLAGKDERFLLQQQQKYWSSTLKPQGGRMKMFTNDHHGLPASNPAGVAKYLMAFINIEARAAQAPKAQKF